MPQPDPRRMPITKLAMLLNSSSLGAVTSSSKLRRYREQGGFAISADGETLDLLKLVAWLCMKRHSRPAAQQQAQGEPARRGPRFTGQGPRF